MTLAEEKGDLLRGTSDIDEFMVADDAQAQHLLTNTRLRSGSGCTRRYSRARLCDGRQITKRQSDRSTSDRKKRGVHVPVTYDRREVGPGDYVIIACDRDEDETECSDLLDIARVEDIRLGGRLGVMWTYRPSYLNVQGGFEFGPFEILFSDHKDIICREVLRGFANVEEKLSRFHVQKSFGEITEDEVAPKQWNWPSMGGKYTVVPRLYETRWKGPIIRKNASLIATMRRNMSICRSERRELATIG
ncbi:hypothetical protein K469DRAFT_690934 [Zopfia rhizophila CBS 207.26]|uniref:BAH domain-containing protein n=1 Tax=Zopfia rhizophila CBS 207.26 TaxID=1314779 RepID=A0A6A6ERB2_9PEZI|nr:hypothetical protein K469DRAFT_690934 [Zopfia rhizophila CBS 207.26]